MTKSNIIQVLCEAMIEGSIKDVPYKKEWDESAKWLTILEKHIKDDKKLQAIFRQYDMADGLCQGAENDYYYREGFLCGARLALEICGK